MVLEQTKGRIKRRDTVAGFRQGNARDLSLCTSFKFKNLGGIETTLFHEFGNSELGLRMQLHLFELQFGLDQFEFLRLNL